MSAMTSTLKHLSFLALFAGSTIGCRNFDVLLAAGGSSTGGAGGSSTGGGPAVTTGTSTSASMGSTGTAGSGSTTGGGNSTTSGGGTPTTSGATTATSGTTTTGGTTTNGGATTTGGAMGCAPQNDGVDCSNCPAGDFCDPVAVACCASFPGAKIDIDGVNGSDATACCGLGTNCPCQTVSRAMALIDTARAKDVIINATVDGGGGDWTPGNEKYPIVLGWGAELSAPGVFFYDPGGGPLYDVIQVDRYSTYDTVGYASIVGAAGNPVGVGMNAANTVQTTDESAISVWHGSSAYLANASINGNATDFYTGAIIATGGTTLWLGQDRSGAVMGTVYIGNALGKTATDGSEGISCRGCTVRDAKLPAGQSSVVIQGQEFGDINAWDQSDILLTSNPTIGVPPVGAGAGTCPALKDEGIVAQGSASLTFKNGIVQCIFGSGFALVISAVDLSVPTVTIDNAVIQNADTGIYASAGTATVTNSTLRYNVTGANQDTRDYGTTNGHIDLSGGGNTVICSSISELIPGSTGFGGIDVLNTSTAELNASNVAWDTANGDAGPDYFRCARDFTTCTCALSSCSAAATDDGLDAVTVDAGITTTGATQSPNGCR
jgi:hypothetical protein